MSNVLSNAQREGIVYDRKFGAQPTLCSGIRTPLSMTMGRRINGRIATAASDVRTSAETNNPIDRPTRDTNTRMNKMPSREPSRPLPQ